MRKTGLSDRSQCGTAERDLFQETDADNNGTGHCRSRSRRHSVVGTADIFVCVIMVGLSIPYFVLMNTS